MKICPECKSAKDAADFYKKGNGLSKLCKPCYCDRVRQNSKTDEGRDSRSQANSRYRAVNRVKTKAHELVRAALRKGLLTKKPCSCCNNLMTVAHHNDYARPLEVTWFCESCHKKWHLLNGEGLNAGTEKNKLGTTKNVYSKNETCENFQREST